MGGYLEAGRTLPFSVSVLPHWFPDDGGAAPADSSIGKVELFRGDHCDGVSVVDCRRPDYRGLPIVGAEDDKNDPIVLSSSPTFTGFVI